MATLLLDWEKAIPSTNWADFGEKNYIKISDFPLDIYSSAVKGVKKDTGKGGRGYFFIQTSPLFSQTHFWGQAPKKAYNKFRWKNSGECLFCINYGRTSAASFAIDEGFGGL
ncbi:hypothetical protein TNIN_243811 [Trichonephila inaurata madagascariensis]|uniref:Uncharacterized protein n=1 Tax=Trichonephila inaurata madagascariensis TaxID=2747483 RepID=A0A8X6XMA8_9ARAC|nr:hypothetical protein TNIN_243811 [Trichonephila inaurata madagascariensis]